MHINNGEYLEAHSTFKKWLPTCHQYPKEEQICIYCGLGEALWGLEEYISAKELYLSALKLDPNNAKVLSGLGGVTGDLNDLGLSFYYYDQALTCGACDATIKVEALNNKAYEYVKFGRFDEALDCLNEAISIDPDNVPSQMNRGYIFYRKNLYDRAIAEFDKAISTITNKEGWSAKPVTRKQYAVTLRNKGVALASSGNYSRAIEFFDEALDYLPSDIDLYLYKGSALANSSQYEEAQICFNQALASDPHNAGCFIVRDAVKQLETKTKDYKDELKKFRKSLLKSQQRVQELSQEYLGRVLSDFTFGLNSAQYMFIVQFVVGIGILLGAVLLNVAGYSATLTYILGAAGGLTIVTSAIFTSPLRIQDNRVDFAQWMMSYFDWVYTLYAAQMLFAQKADEGKSQDWEDIKVVHEDLHAITREAVHMIETYCTVDNKKGTRKCPEINKLPRKVCFPLKWVPTDRSGSGGEPGESGEGDIANKGKMEKELNPEYAPIQMK
ncbi:hypothetical protein ABH15_09380 [Methanoculleus taiwanensis]|uniref:Uncharacterized protein n=2 Tax=Methanoculleus taiwanensis TaxID=1550565 RepID=A0A498H302_9EURY|nr:hypothetical protein ABH15_09380 [Methanoculleus taiwanensis]